MFTAQQCHAIHAGWARLQARMANETPDWALPVDQAQEHWDHVAGSASDHQNAYWHSQAQRRSGMQGVMDLVRADLHVVVMQGPAYCRSTDAIIGSHYSVLACFRDRDAALAEVGALYEQWGDAGIGDECGLAVYPLHQPEPAAAPTADDWDEIPF